MVSPWPGVVDDWLDQEAERQMDELMAVVRAIRSLRGDLGMGNERLERIVLRPPDAESEARLEGMAAYIMALTRSAGVSLLPNLADPPAHSLGISADGVELFVPVRGGEIERVRLRLQQERERLRGELGRVDTRLSNDAFVQRAPAEVVEAERQRAEELRRRLEAVHRHIRSVG